jgi:predicted dehydrogenase
LNRTRIACVGGGYFSQFHYDAWRRLPVDVVGVCDLDARRATGIADGFAGASAFTDTAQMLDAVRPDLLDVIVPPAAQLAPVRAALTRGINVICQKPFTPSLDQARALANEAREASVMLAVHENFRFQPWFQALRRLLDDNALGTVYQVSFRLRPGDGQGPDAYLARQPYFQSMPRFLLHETGIHLVDVFRFLLGDVTRVMAWLTRLNPHIAGEDAGVVLFDFASGARGVFDGNRLVDHIAEDRRRTMGDMLIEGDRAVARLNGSGDVWLRSHGSNDEERVAFTWEQRGFAGDSVYRFQEHVLAHLREGAPLANSADDYLNNMRVVEAAYRSSATGTWEAP